MFVHGNCEKALDKEPLNARARNTICVLSEFQGRYLAPRNLALPLSREDFIRHFDEFRSSRVLLDGNGLDHWVGFDCTTGRATWLRDRYVLNVRRDASVDDRSKVFAKWRKWLEDRAKARPDGATKPILASRDEVMANLESNIVQGSVVAALLSVGASLVCMLCLTRVAGRAVGPKTIPRRASRGSPLSSRPSLHRIGRDNTRSSTRAPRRRRTRP